MFKFFFWVLILKIDFPQTPIGHGLGCSSFLRSLQVQRNLLHVLWHFGKLSAVWCVFTVFFEMCFLEFLFVSF